MEKLIKVIQWILSKFIEYKFEAIITITVGAIMSFIAALQSIPLFYRIPIILFTILCVLFILRLSIWIYDHFTNSIALEIIYDSGYYNGAEKKITRERGIEEYIDVFAYRVKICNNSNSIIHGIEILVETEEEKLPHRAFFTKFKNTEEYYCDIYPKSCEIVTLFYWRGELKPTKVTLKCRGKEMPEKIKTLIL